MLALGSHSEAPTIASTNVVSDASFVKSRGLKPSRTLKIPSSVLLLSHVICVLQMVQSENLDDAFPGNTGLSLACLIRTYVTTNYAVHHAVSNAKTPCPEI